MMRSWLGLSAAALAVVLASGCSTYPPGAGFTTSVSPPAPGEDSPKVRSDLPAPPVDSGDAKLAPLTPDLPDEYFAPARKRKGE
jgi:hypothetical protein